MAEFFFGLSFLDYEEVEECFVFNVFFEAPESEKAIEFAYYVANNYINQSPSFPPITWADSHVECKRTTNRCESFHKEFSTMFYSSHPNIFDFLAKIQSVQTKSCLKMRTAMIEFLWDKRKMAIQDRKRTEIKV